MLRCQYITMLLPWIFIRHSVKVGPRPWDPGSRDTPESLKVEPGTPLSFESGTHIMVFLHCFIYYILYETLRHFLKEIIFHEYSPSHILCSELIHHFLEGFKFYSQVHVTVSLLNTGEWVFLEAEGEIFIERK